MIAAETRGELLAALATLRDDDREILGARFLLDLSEAETAETLGLPAAPSSPGRRGPWRGCVKRSRCRVAR